MYIRYLDNNSISGTLDIGRLFALGLLSTNSSGSLRVLSLMNNDISDVIYDLENIENINSATIR